MKAAPATAYRLARAASFATSATSSVKLADCLPKETLDDIYAHAVKKQTGVSLKYMLDFGLNPLDKQLLFSAQFLHRELPVRLAHRVAELENLPYGLSENSSIRRVRDWYVESFKDIRRFRPIKDSFDEFEFTECLKNIYRRHTHVVPVMARGVSELREDLENRSNSLHDLPDVHQFLDGFYLSRIGIRILIGQHISLHEPPKENHIGLICTKCSPVQVAEVAVSDARNLCLRQYGTAPEVDVYGSTRFTLPYVPSHLHHMVFELVKNSLRAVQDRWEDDDCEPPPIRVVVAEGGEDVTIKVSDEGGGIPRSGLPRIWTYLYSTAKHPVDHTKLEGDEAGPVVLAGYGYGLPLSRLYARYFGGDLQMISMEGYGTDAYLHLNRLGNSQEPLP
uniref:Protein-serine/threonine kinase n=1 Tax=Polytomella parva TaxID=51329 RepID=A0A7S0V6I7_9CHLO|mmetsp:Transcript_28896/g.53085  ORF Transcript_28896/g.53085 Transcript_28896/m.53085 type:complete len:392 (+) Transcript_28896:175-1350(+)|eukprot:CAMPEP_0175041722 /NCGR_PEP_ID=MMETSP0052_2-20121109/2101_1 /TAXON_ID=51329 ORGANISM="Polytomella parva, Strain SAG 63-3" /NCGR_SAMPLE_ID=MMETSP0052_2 /ASSEMBLY_ACC=CAM_ASM_000194 /LENGTH=391 /DNA_ID=CAMNT_0016304325 /DNA_START=156 /DNA_END=1331 /DNA_ORIENTATION=-